MSEQTFYRWKRQFAGMGVVATRRLRQVEEENRKFSGTLCSGMRVPAEQADPACRLPFLAVRDH